MMPDETGSRAMSTGLEVLRRKRLYLWGAGAHGADLLTGLQRNGLGVEGFIDSDPSLQGGRRLGLVVRSPDEVLSHRADRPDLAVIVSVGSGKERCLDACEAHGLRRDVDLWLSDDFIPAFYYVEVSGVCNLRCISCALGQGKRTGGRGMLSLSSYRSVLDKILDESPLTGSIQLAALGEPFLNPELPEIITHTLDRGLRCSTSTNLHVGIGRISRVLRSRPTLVRVSLSGTHARYERTHTGGRWERFAESFRRLPELRDELSPETVIEVAFHAYADNLADLETIRQACLEAGFVFRPLVATVQSLEDVEAHLKGEAVAAAAREALGLLAEPIDETVERLRRENPKARCPFIGDVPICWNLSVSKCPIYLPTERNLACENYLETPLDQILTAKADRRDLCAFCEENRLYLLCNQRYVS